MVAVALDELTHFVFWGPYVGSFKSGGLNPGRLMYFTNIIFIFYFLSLFEIDNLKKTKILIWVFSLSTIYLIYWANNQYFSGNWHQFSMGRLMGPASIDGGAIYKDENAFAMLFVTGLPFIYYLSLDLKSKLLRYASWLVILFGWHAIFLTGSRGGLVGLGAVILSVVFLSQKKLLAIPVLLLFWFFIITKLVM